MFVRVLELLLHLYRLNFPCAQLDQIILSTIIDNFSDIFKDFQPEELFLPHPGDIHSDHRITLKQLQPALSGFVILQLSVF